MIINPLANILNQKSMRQRLISISVANLHAASYTLILVTNGTTLAATPISQNLPNQSPSNSQQLPILNPSPTLNSPITPPLVNETSPNLEAPQNQFNLYRLGAGDAISVFVQGFPDLSFQAALDQEGYVFVPLLGRISLLGLTLREAQEKIRFGLNRFVVEPEVNVSLAGQRPVQVTVIGEVTKPGFYPLSPNTPITAALLVAGGANTTADLRSITIRRSLIDGSIIEQKVDLFTPLQNAQAQPNIRLQDGDAVIVPKLEVGNTQDYDRTLVSRSTLATPQITIRVISYANNGIGNITLPNGSSFLDALTAIAPGSDNANLREIALIRFDQEKGKPVTQKLDGKRALLGDISQNVPLQNQDVIVVGRSLIAKLNYALNFVTRPIQDILGFRLFFDLFDRSRNR